MERSTGKVTKINSPTYSKLGTSLSLFQITSEGKNVGVTLGLRKDRKRRDQSLRNRPKNLSVGVEELRNLLRSGFLCWSVALTRDLFE
jgi:hypothetical protein